MVFGEEFALSLFIFLLYFGAKKVFTDRKSGMHHIKWDYFMKLLYESEIILFSSSYM